MAGPYGGRGFYPQQKKSGNRVNNEIRSPQVRLIDTDGAQLGVKSIAEALYIARSKQLDLVEVAPQAAPPVCRILAYSKFKYEQEKKERESRKHQKAGMLKEVRFSPVIGPHDLDVKLRHAEDFLKAHDKVRFTVVFRGRQNQHQDLGSKLLNSIKERFKEIAMVESDFSKERNRLSITLAPRK